MSDDFVPTLFGELVWQYRRKAHLSRKDLARRTGLSEYTIYFIETGRRGVNPQAETIKVLAEVLHAPIYEFLRAVGWIDRFREFVNEDPNLDNAQRRILIATYEAFFRDRKR